MTAGEATLTLSQMAAMALVLGVLPEYEGLTADALPLRARAQAGDGTGDHMPIHCSAPHAS